MPFFLKRGHKSCGCGRPTLAQFAWSWKYCVLHIAGKQATGLVSLVVTFLCMLCADISLGPSHRESDWPGAHRTLQVDHIPVLGTPAFVSLFVPPPLSLFHYGYMSTQLKFGAGDCAGPSLKQSCDWMHLAGRCGKKSDGRTDLIHQDFSYDHGLCACPSSIRNVILGALQNFSFC